MMWSQIWTSCIRKNWKSLILKSSVLSIMRERLSKIKFMLSLQVSLTQSTISLRNSCLFRFWFSFHLLWIDVWATKKSFRTCERLRLKYSNILIYLYFNPSISAMSLKPQLDNMSAIFPFVRNFYKNFNMQYSNEPI